MPIIDTMMVDTAEHCPAVVVASITDVVYGLAWVRAELASGAVLKLIYPQTGRFRAWILPAAPPGAAAARVSLSRFTRRRGQVLDAVRGGQVIEVRNGAEDRAEFFLSWDPPSALEKAEGVLPYGIRTSRGTVIGREFPSARDTLALPVPRPARTARAAVLP